MSEPKKFTFTNTLEYANLIVFYDIIFCMNILKLISSWIKENWIYIVIFCLLFSLRVCAINNKTVFFFDDPASFNVSTPNNLFEDGSKIKYSWADLRFYYHQNYVILEQNYYF